MEITGLSKLKILISVLSIILVIALSFFIIFNNLGKSSLFGDEAIYAQVARESSDGSIFPLTLRGNRYMAKPPLKEVLTTLIFNAWGVSELDARLLDGIFGMFTIILTLFLGWYCFGFRAGVMASLLLVTANLYIFEHGVRDGVHESMLVFFLAASLFLFMLYLRKGRRPPWLLVSCGALSGLATYLKGPVGLIIVPVVFISNLILVKDKKIRRAILEPLLIFCVAGIIHLPWIIYLLSETSSGFIYHLQQNLVVRAVKTLDPAHSHGILFYGDVLRRDFGFWSLFLLPVLIILINSVKEKISEGIEAEVVLTAWTFFIIIGFSLSASKLHWYIFPAYPALAVILGYGFDITYKKIRETGPVVIILLLVLMMGRDVYGSLRMSVRDTERIDLHRFLEKYEDLENPYLFVEQKLKNDKSGFREWNYYYVSLFKNMTWGIPRRLEIKNARVFLLTSDPCGQSQLYRDENVRLYELKKFHSSEADLFLIDLSPESEPVLFSDHEWEKLRVKCP
jgi:4-amino-4-deoxy-L-arabinose transferase-like glycosyltransferase